MNSDFKFVRSFASMWYLLRLAAYLRRDADRTLNNHDKNYSFLPDVGLDVLFEG